MGFHAHNTLSAGVRDTFLSITCIYPLCRETRAVMVQFDVGFSGRRHKGLVNIRHFLITKLIILCVIKTAIGDVGELLYNIMSAQW